MMNSDRDAAALNRNNNLPGDFHSIHPTDYAACNIRSELLHTEYSISVDGDIDDFGLTLHRVGSQMAISAGSILGDSETSLSIYLNIEAEQAREIADQLHQAAKEAENAEKQSSNKQTKSKSLIGRFLYE